MALLRYTAKFDPFLSLDCTPTPSTLAQSKERKGSNFAIWQHCPKGVMYNNNNIGGNINTNSNLAAVVYDEDNEETGAALELSECIAESLMDHFTERGLLAKEIKVREVS